MPQNRSRCQNRFIAIPRFWPRYLVQLRKDHLRRGQCLVSLSGQGSRPERGKIRVVSCL
jgi:hypothetical protein